PLVYPERLAPSPAFMFFLYCRGPPRDLHSFPTRRSSDLTGCVIRVEATSSETAPSTPCSCSRCGASSAPGASHSPSSASSRKARSEEHTSELQSRFDLVCRLLLEKKKKKQRTTETQGRNT